MIEYSGETGACLQHLGILVGREARAKVWPDIMAWIDLHSEAPRSERKRSDEGLGVASRRAKVSKMSFLPEPVAAAPKNQQSSLRLGGS